MIKRISILFMVCLLAFSISAQTIEVTGSRKAVRTSGDVGAALLPVAGLTAILIKKTGKTRMQGSPDYPRQCGADRLFPRFGLQAGDHHVYVAGLHRAWIKAAQVFINLDGIVVLLQAFV